MKNKAQIIFDKTKPIAMYKTKTIAVEIGTCIENLSRAGPFLTVGMIIKKLYR